MAGNAVPLTEVTPASAIKRLDDADHGVGRKAIHQFTCSVTTIALSALPATSSVLQKGPRG